VVIAFVPVYALVAMALAQVRPVQEVALRSGAMRPSAWPGSCG
jgi:hypothetical protein